MRASGKGLKLSKGLLMVCGLGKEASIETRHLIRPGHEPAWPPSANGQGLCAGELRCDLPGSGTRCRKLRLNLALIDMRCARLERDSRSAKKILARTAFRGKYERPLAAPEGRHDEAMNLS